MNINRSRLLDTIIVGLIAGVIGARLLCYLLSGDKFYQRPKSVFLYPKIGLGIYGGIIKPYWLDIICQIPKTKY